jgi:hypothetical protein
MPVTEGQDKLPPLALSGVLPGDHASSEQVAKPIPDLEAADYETGVRDGREKDTSLTNITEERTLHDQNIVSWDGPNDPLNPQNW